MTDLTKITTPFGLLDAETRAALRAHGGPYEYFSVRGEWCEEKPVWLANGTYRVKPQPPKPREMWTVGPFTRPTREEAEWLVKVGHAVGPISHWVEVPPE